MTAPAWTTGTLVSFDTETTGVDTETDRIVTASVVTINVTTSTVRTHEWLLDPGIDIPAEATDVHGITTEHARKHGQPPDEAVPNIVATLLAELDQDGTLIVYNAPYDLTLLDRELRRHSSLTPFPGNPPTVVDPLVLDRALDKYRKGSRKLIDVSRHYGVPISEADAHGSTADAMCAARVAWKIAHKFPVQCADLVELQAMQAVWHRGWATHFGAYLTAQGRPDDVCREWPLRPWAG